MDDLIIPVPDWPDVVGGQCHQCHQKTYYYLECTHDTYIPRGQTLVKKRLKVCGLLFCGNCCRSRYGIDIQSVLESDEKWRCPPCGGFCNCSRCRRAIGLMPLGSGIGVYAQERGMSVADVLSNPVHCAAAVAETERRAAVRARKASKQAAAGLSAPTTITQPGPSALTGAMPFAPAPVPALAPATPAILAWAREFDKRPVSHQQPSAHPLGISHPPPALP